MHVKLVYHSYAINMAIFIDDQPIGMVSALSKYQTLPFSMWYTEILNAIAYEVNDKFNLTYVGRMCEFELLKSAVKNCPSCISLKYEQPLIADSTLIRLKKLSRLVMNGVACSRFSIPLHLFTDYAQNEIDNILKPILPKLSFCKFNTTYHDLSETLSQDDRKYSLAVVSDKVSDQRCINIANSMAGVVCVRDQTNTNISAQGAIILFAQTFSIAKSLEEIMELVYYPGVLKSALERVSIPDNSPFFPEVFILDKIEPQTFVKLPKSIEYGCVAQAQVATIPRTGKTPVLSYRISNESVIAYTTGGLKAVGTGEAVVEVYEAGKTVPICSGTITAFRANWIQKITIQPATIQMCVGESANLSYSYSPENADDHSRVCLISEDGTIAAVQGNLSVAGRRPGNCAVYYEATKTRSARCNVSVYPRLESVEMSIDNSIIQQNSLAKVHLRRVPENAILDKLTVKVEPSYLGTYDMGSGSFFARQPGSGQLIVSSDRSNVKMAVPIEVKKAVTFDVKKLLIPIGIAALVLILWLLVK